MPPAGTYGANRGAPRPASLHAGSARFAPRSRDAFADETCILQLQPTVKQDDQSPSEFLFDRRSVPHR